MPRRSKKKQDRMSALPNELLFKVLGSLYAKDVLSCQRLSKKFYTLATDNLLWKELYLTQYGTKGRRTFEKENENDHEYWLKQYMLCYNWDRGICHTYSMEFPGPGANPEGEQRTVCHFDSYGGYAFLIEVHCRSIPTRETGRCLAWLLHVRDMYPDGRANKFVTRRLAPGEKPPGQPRAFENLFEAQEDVLEPVVMTLDSAHQNPDIIQLAVVWSDCLVQTFSFNTITRSLKHGPSQTISIQTGNVTEPLFAYHHPYLTLPICGKESGAANSMGIKIVEIKANTDWPKITSFINHGSLTIFSAKWRKSEDDIHLDILKRDNTLCSSWEDDTVDVPFRVLSAKMSEMVNKPEKCVRAYFTTFNVVKNKKEQLQEYQLEYPFLVHGGIDLKAKKLVQHATYTRVSVMSLDLPDTSKYYRPIVDNKGNVVLLEGHDCAPFGLSNIEGRLLASPIDEVDRYTLTKPRKFTPVHIATIQPPRQPQRAPTNMFEMFCRVGQKIAPPEYQAMSISKRYATRLDDERLSVLFSERDRLTFCWIRVQVYDFKYTVETYLANRRALRAKPAEETGS